MRLLLFLILFSVNFLQFIAAPSAPIVTTKLGKVKGIVKSLDDGTPVNLYLGIRFGETTAGDHRFAKPIPASPWNDTYDATKVRYSCTQQSDSAGAPSSEDCLFLSVWSPAKVESETKRSVMLWIYGGAFKSGSEFSIAYDARYIAALGDVIVVTINYRLGPFGFVYGGTDDAPGNLGLYDQILALKWTKDNIEAFGGDPNSITIFGESAGGMSVGALVLSPLTAGLFKRAILQSGAPNSYLGSEAAATSLVKTKDLAENLGCNQSSVAEQIKCLRHKTTEEIFQSQSHSTLISQPIYGDHVLPTNPSSALREGKFNHNIDLLFGTVKDEGSVFVTSIFKDLNPDKELNITVSKAVSYIVAMFTLMKTAVAATAGLFYTSGLKDSDKDKLAQAVGQSFGDFHIICPTVLFGEEYAKMDKNHNVYGYRVSHIPGASAHANCKGWMGVCHGEDVVFLFGFPIKLRGIKFTELDYKLSKDIIHVWSTFAKTGKTPSLDNVHWPEAIDRDVSNPSVRVMDLNPEKYQVLENAYKSNCDGFWKSYL